MADIELKHCPFCGGTATTNCDESGFWEVSCDDCPCAMNWSYETEKAAIEAWNRMEDTAKINTKEAVLPIPVKQADGVDVKTLTMKQWFTKINEELDELKEVMLRWNKLESVGCDVDKTDDIAIADEAADVVTAITSMLDAIGIDERARQAAQMWVNEKNRQRGRL